MRTGIYFPTLEALPAIKQAGFDYVLVWNGHDPWPFLNNNLGLKVAIDVRGRENLISDIRTHPNLEAWYIADEPSSYQDLNRLREIYNFYKPLTLHPIFLANLPWLEDNNLWRELVLTGDISCVDVYPKTVDGYFIQDVYNRLIAARNLSPERKLYYIPQAFSGGVFLRPTPEEYREMISLAKLAGVSGILVFAWDSHITRQVGVIGVTDKDPLWPEIARINSETKSSILPLVLAGLAIMLIRRRT